MSDMQHGQRAPDGSESDFARNEGAIRDLSNDGYSSER